MNGGLLGLVAIQTMRTRALKIRAAQYADGVTTKQLAQLIDDHEKLLDAYAVARARLDRAATILDAGHSYDDTHSLWTTTNP